MTTMEPVGFWRKTFPELFGKGVRYLRARAEMNDERARVQLQDIEAANGAAYLEIEGEGSVWLAVENGDVRSVDTRPDGLPVRLAVAIPAAAMRAALAELAGQGRLQREETAVQAACTASGRVQRTLEGHRLRFHLVIDGVPELGRVVLKVGLGVAEPPPEPEFVATVQFEDLERVRDGEIGLTQLLTGGRVRFQGDYAPALQLGMQLSSLHR